LVVVVASAGIWYYFFIYIPGYEAERARLLTFNAIANPVDLDPALASESDSNRIVINVFDRLVSYKRGTTEIQPNLATGWEIPDPKTYVFTLKQGVVFHDGTRFNASCVKYSFERVIELNGAPSFLLSVINSTEVLSAYNVKITLNFEFSPFLSVLAHPVASIVSPTAAAKYGENFTKNPIGSGPFKFVSWTKGKELVLVANKNYFKGPPKLERVVFKSILEASARKAALEKGEVDAVMGGGGILASDLPSLENNPDVHVSVYKGSSFFVEYMGFNMLKPPLNDSRVREAISYAIDYDAIINDALGGTANMISGPIPPSIFGYKELPLRQRDLGKARELLKAAGYPKGFDITLTYNIESLDRRKMAETIRGSLADVGINVKIQGLDWESAINEYLSMGHELMLNGWTPDYFDPDAYLSPQFHSNSLAPNGANIFGLSDPEIDSLIDEGLTTSDQNQRVKIYAQLQSMIVDRLPAIFLANPSAYDCVRYNVKNWVLSPTELPEFYELFKQ
jgi:peptide/nickel transport system substrate-binding protein